MITENAYKQIFFQILDYKHQRLSASTSFSIWKMASEMVAFNISKMCESQNIMTNCRLTTYKNNGLHFNNSLPPQTFKPSRFIMYSPQSTTQV